MDQVRGAKVLRIDDTAVSLGGKIVLGYMWPAEPPVELPVLSRINIRIKLS